MASIDDFLAPLAPPSATPAGYSTLLLEAEEHHSSPESDCIFVGNLPKKYTKLQLEKIVRQLFTTYGPVEYTKASMDKKGRPYCFVKFLGSSPSQASRKILSDEIILDNRVLRVEMAKGQPVKANFPILSSNSLATVEGNGGGGGGGGSSVNSLRFSTCISQSSSFVCQSKGISAASSNYSPSPVLSSNSVSLNAGTSCGPTSSSDSCAVAVTVSNLNVVFVSEQLICKYFSKYGNVISAKMLSSSGFSGAVEEGSARVYFEDAVSAQRAIFNEDGNVWLGKSLKVALSPPNSTTTLSAIEASMQQPVLTSSSDTSCTTEEQSTGCSSKFFISNCGFPRPISPLSGGDASVDGKKEEFFDFSKSLQLPYHAHLAGHISIPPGLHLVVANAAGAGTMTSVKSSQIEACQITASSSSSASKMMIDVLENGGGGGVGDLLF